LRLQIKDSQKLDSVIYILDDIMIGRQNPLDRGDEKLVDTIQLLISKLVPKLKVITRAYQKEGASIVTQASCLPIACIFLDYLFLTCQHYIV
jgi:hypothetical protein